MDSVGNELPECDSIEKGKRSLSSFLFVCGFAKNKGSTIVYDKLSKSAVITDINGHQSKIKHV